MCSVGSPVHSIAAGTHDVVCLAQILTVAALKLAAERDSRYADNDTD